jgi:hypothetical protein
MEHGDARTEQKIEFSIPCLALEFFKGDAFRYRIQHGAPNSTASAA